MAVAAAIGCLGTPVTAGAQAADPAPAQPPRPADEPAIVAHLKEGEPLEGELISLTTNQLRMRVVIGVGSADRTIPYDEIDYILFHPEPGEEQLLAAPDYDRDADELVALYARKSRFLGFPRSNAGEVGLAYARLVLERMREHPEEDQEDDGSDAAETGGRPSLVVFQRALRFCQEVEQGDWDDARRSQARLVRLQLLLADGQRAEVIREARELVDSTRSLEIHLEGRLILADAAFDELQWLVEDNPRWFEDDIIRPRRDELFHDTLDAFLYPSLFHPTREEAAARGLLGAARVYEHAGELPLALACATDIIALYPDSEAALEARELIAAQPRDEAAEEVVAGADQAAADAAAAAEPDRLIDDPLMRSMQDQLQRRRVTPLDNDAAADDEPAGDAPDAPRFDDEDF